MEFPPKASYILEVGILQMGSTWNSTGGRVNINLDNLGKGPQKQAAPSMNQLARKYNLIRLTLLPTQCSLCCLSLLRRLTRILDTCSRFLMESDLGFNFFW